MRRLALTIALTAAAYAVLNDATAGETLAERKRWRSESEYARTDVRQTSDRCGTPIDLEFEKPSFRGYPSGSSIHVNCLVAHFSLKQLCDSDATTRKAIASRVRKVVCVHSKDKSVVTFEGNVLRLEANPLDPDLKAVVHEQIAQELKPATPPAVSPEIAVQEK